MKECCCCAVSSPSRDPPAEMKAWRTQPIPIRTHQKREKKRNRTRLVTVAAIPTLGATSDLFLLAQKSKSYVLAPTAVITVSLQHCLQRIHGSNT